MKRIKLGLFLCLIVMVCASCSNVHSHEENVIKKETVRIGYLPTTHAFPLFLEKENLAKDENFTIELIRFGSWPDLMDALNTGRIDGASVLMMLAMKAKSQGIDLKAVALAHRDGNAVVVANHIDRVEDLRGESVAIPHKFSTHNVLRYQMFKRAGISDDEVNVIELTPAEMPAALAEGRISGYVVAEPFGAVSVVNKNGKVLYQSEEIWPEALDCAVVFKEDFMRVHEELVEEFILHYVLSGQLADANKDELKKASLDYVKFENDVMDVSLEWISYADLRIDPKAYEELVDSITEMKLFENPPSYDMFVNHTFIDKVK